jgi:hypothetical protein
MAWGWLGKLLGGAASVAAAPFTGGASLAALGPILSAGGQAVGAASQGAAQNRGSQFGGQMDLANLLMQRELAQKGLEGSADRDYFDQVLRREQEGRTGRDDAWHKLISSQRTLSPGVRPQLSPYSVAPRHATDMERQGADALSAEVLARLQGGNPIGMPTRRDTSLRVDPMATIEPRLLRAGTGEKIGGWLAPIMGGVGAWMGRPRNPQNQSPDDLWGTY